MSEIEFSYEGDDGPLHWKEMFDGANGLNQSPINIVTKNAIFKPVLFHEPIKIHYDDCNQIKNTGHSFQICITEQTDSHVSGGPVRQKHKFLQMHMHWGLTDERGSEHSVDEKFYSAEIHFVNWNCTVYSTPQEASNSQKHDGLLVFGVFAQLGKANPELGKIIKHFNHIHNKGDVDELHEHIIWKNLFPKDLNKFYTYRGSLTTPPCSECVRWLIFQDPIEISHEQLAELRNLSTSKSKEARMMCNDRPVCPLGDRKVYKSFE